MMNRTSLFPVLIVVALVSGAIGYWLKPSGGLSHEERATLEQYENIKNKFDELGQVDVAEYLRLKDQKARYEKADEILGKILMLMLYDLGIRNSEGQLQALKNRAMKAAPAAGDAERPVAASADGNAGATDSAAGSGPKEPVKPAAPEVPDWKKNSERVKEIYSANQVEDFLKSAEIPNFFNELKGGGLLSAEQLEILNGSFYGRAVFDDPIEAPWQVIMRVDVRIEGDKYAGEHDIRLSKNGKQFSRSRSTGRRGGQRGQGQIDADSFMAADGDPNAILVNVYGDNGYFQLYYFSRLNEYHGLVYLKKSIGQFERKGVVHLTKR